MLITGSASSFEIVTVAEPSPIVTPTGLNSKTAKSWSGSYSVVADHLNRDRLRGFLGLEGQDPLAAM